MIVPMFSHPTNAKAADPGKGCGFLGAKQLNYAGKRLIAPLRAIMPKPRPDCIVVCTSTMRRGTASTDLSPSRRIGSRLAHYG